MWESVHVGPLTCGAVHVGDRTFLAPRNPRGSITYPAMNKALLLLLVALLASPLGCGRGEEPNFQRDDDDRDEDSDESDDSDDSDDNAGTATAMGGSNADDDAEEPEEDPDAIPAPPDVAAPPEDATREESGLATKVLQAGTGTTNPSPEQRVRVHYTGWQTNGDMFDSSVARGEPSEFGVTQVIPGWIEGLQLMVVGEKRRMWIPASMAYEGRPERPPGNARVRRRVAGDPLMGTPADHAERMARVLLCLEGLSVGDGFGERFFANPAMVAALIESRAVPKAPWAWTDDTAMALSVVQALDADGGIVPDHLAKAFAERFAAEPERGYGAGAIGILRQISQEVPWEHAAGWVFNGAGSMGNGGGMRSAPVGAYFADDLDAVVENARLSAKPTHAHPDGQAGAIAIAVASAVAVQIKAGDRESGGQALLETVLGHTPDGPTKEGIARACALTQVTSSTSAAGILGSGNKVLSSDTVPYALWCASRCLEDFEEAMWFTVAGLGDRDTTCAMVGGIVSLSAAALPESWVAAREPLPA